MIPRRFGEEPAQSAVALWSSPGIKGSGPQLRHLVRRENSSAKYGKAAMDHLNWMTWCKAA
jgi:hypothetical protein